MTQYTSIYIEVPKEIQTFEKQVAIVLSLYFTLIEADPFRARINEFRALSDWLVDTKPMMNYYDTKERLYWPTQRTEDICAICYSSYGEVLGGRARIGCIECQQEHSFLLNYKSQIQDILYVSGAYLEYLCAEALYLWSRTKSRKILTAEGADHIEGTFEEEPRNERITATT